MCDKAETVESLKCVKHVVCRGGYLKLNDATNFFKLFKNATLINCTGSAETGDFIYDIFNSIRDVNRKKVTQRITLGMKKIISSKKLNLNLKKSKYLKKSD